MFKVGDYVTWAFFDKGEPEVGTYWDGTSINPRGYKVLSISKDNIFVESKTGVPVLQSHTLFRLVQRKKSISRNLPEWF